MRSFSFPQLTGGGGATRRPPPRHPGANCERDDDTRLHPASDLSRPGPKTGACPSCTSTAGSRTAARFECATIGAGPASTSVPRTPSARARLGARTPEPTDRKTFDGAPVARIEVAAPSDVPPLRDRLHAAGIDTFEADVRFASRYLIERGIKGGCEIVGDATPAPSVTRGRSTIRRCSRRARRGRAARACRSTSRRTRHGRNAARDLALCAGHRRSADRRRRNRADARARRALRGRDSCARAFCERVRTFDPDVLTGLEHRSTSISRCCIEIAARVTAPVQPRPRRRRPAAAQGRRLFRQRPSERSRDGSCSTASTCCAARSCGWTTTRSMPSRARCSAKAKRSRATSAIGSPRSSTTTRTISRRSRCTRGRTRGSRIRSSRSSTSCRSRSRAAR